MKDKKVWLLAGMLAAAGFIIWPGCASPPLPSSRYPLSALKPADFKFEKEAHPSRAEIIAKLGQPDETFPDLHVICYRLNRLSRRRLVLVFGLPVAWPKDSDRLEVALIEFDNSDRAKRVKIDITDNFPGTFSTAKQWLAEMGDDSHSH